MEQGRYNMIPTRCEREEIYIYISISSAGVYFFHETVAIHGV